MNEKDQKILDTILANAAKSKRPLRRGDYGTSNKSALEPKDWYPVDMDDPEETYPCCAVGAGLLFCGLGRSCDKGSPLPRFAAQYRVSEDYAWGVSNGFEDALEDHGALGDDYTRGYSVGRAVWKKSQVQP